jgi:hypothetical protein
VHKNAPLRGTGDLPFSTGRRLGPLLSASTGPGSEGSHADQVLGKLIMGFVERRVSPLTIADVVLAQISEGDCQPSDLSTATCNGILEALASTSTLSGMQEIISFLARRDDFPRFLSPSAAMGTLCSLLLNPFLQDEPSEHRFRETLRILDALGKHNVEILALYKGSTELKAAKMRLTNALKSAHHLISNAGQTCPHLMVLRQVLLKGVEPSTELLGPATFTSVQSVITAITNTPDHVLVHHIPRDYRTTTVAGQECSKLDFLDAVLKALASGSATRFQCGFLVEWLFAGCLRQACLDGDAEACLIHAIDLIIHNAPQRLDVCKGVIRALQKDLSVLHSDFGNITGATERLERARQTAAQVFHALWSQKGHPWQWIAQELLPWALQLPCYPPESRLVTRSQVEWLQMMQTRQWSEGVTEPPGWIVREASRTTAVVFQMAPGHWLQLFAEPFVDALHREATSSGFILASEHIDFVEYLVRTLRRKSPLFASEAETLVCLQILGRARLSEQNQMKLAVTRLRLQSSGGAVQREQTRFLLGLLTQMQQVEALGPNPVARALSLLAICCRHVKVKSRRETLRRTGQPQNQQET